MARRRRDEERRAQSPGQQARDLGGALLLVGLVLGLLGAAVRSGEADLRDLSALQTVEAQVVDIDTRRRAPDLFDLAYDVAGRQMTARVPYSGPARVGDRCRSPTWRRTRPGRARWTTGARATGCSAR